MKRWTLVIAVAVLYLLHQDFWFWHQAQPVILGLLPIGLFYHICYTLVVVVLMMVLVVYAWPKHLEKE